MIDLHSHSLFSDGALVPAEHLRRVEVLGYQAIAITDHADSSNLEWIVQGIAKAARDLNALSSTRLIPADFLTPEMAEKIGYGAGLSTKRYHQLQKDVADLLERL